MMFRALPSRVFALQTRSAALSATSAFRARCLPPAPRAAPLSFGVVVARRFCATVAPVDPTAAAAAAATATTGPAAPTRALSDVGELTDGDKALLRQAMYEAPESQPAFHEGKRIGSPGSGSKNANMAAIFTCEICQHRSVKRFSRECYTKGIVIVQCPKCGSKHLLADNMGWFVDEHKNIEDILKARGEEVVKLSGSIYIDKLECEGDAQEAPAAAQITGGTPQ